jgi:hypothetical protein
MNIPEFEGLVDKRLDHCRKLLGVKNKEYANGGDKLSNFKEAAALKGETPEMALWGMWAKHIISVKKIVLEIDGEIPTEKMLDDKFSDMINYTLLLEGLIQERRKRADGEPATGRVVPFPILNTSKIVKDAEK